MSKNVVRSSNSQVRKSEMNLIEFHLCYACFPSYYLCNKLFAFVKV